MLYCDVETQIMNGLVTDEVLKTVCVFMRIHAILLFHLTRCYVVLELALLRCVRCWTSSNNNNDKRQ